MTTEPKVEGRCSGWVSHTGTLHPHQCRSKATVVRDGKPYCTTHDPLRRAEKQAAGTRIREAGWETRVQEKRALNACPDLVAALEDLLGRLGWDSIDAVTETTADWLWDSDSGAERVYLQARAALAKAKGG